MISRAGGAVLRDLEGQGGIKGGINSAVQSTGSLFLCEALPNADDLQVGRLCFKVSV